MDNPGWQAELASIIAPGSLIGVRTGDVDNWFAQWGGAGWRQVLPPTHAHYCSRPALSRLLLRHDFVVRHRSRRGMNGSLDTMAFSLLQHNGRARGSIVG
jgi:hypothetical protein